MSYEYGFFNAIKQYDPSTGAFLGYDRTYDNETFVKYFEGLISGYGVFRSVNDRFTITASRMEETNFAVTIAPGKAMVNGRWISNSGYEILELPAPDTAKIRKDAIVIRWDETNRRMGFDVVKGVECDYDANNDDISVLHCTETDPAGFVWDEYPRSGHWDLTTVENPDVAEIVLAYVVMRPRITELSQNDIVMATGSARCPWISRLAVEPLSPERDIDAVLAWYRGQIDAWFLDLVDDFTEKQGTIVYLNRQEKMYSGGTPLPLHLSKLDWFVLDVRTDTFNVYLNGRRLSKHDDFEVVSDNDDGAIIRFLKISETTLPDNNEILVQVLKGESLPLRVDPRD